MSMVRVRVNAEKCTGCRICELICSFSNFGEFNPKRSRIRVVKAERVFMDMPVVCRQCLKPACANVCHEKALVRDEMGVIRLNEGLCSGCESCVEVCPFGAISVDPLNGMPIVCNMCNGDALCVKWCPTGALENSRQENVSQRKRWEKAVSSSQSMLRKWGIPLEEFEDYYGKLTPSLGPINIFWGGEPTVKV